MLKETIVFFVAFLLLVEFRLGGGGGSPPSGYAYVTHSLNLQNLSRWAIFVIFRKTVGKQIHFNSF